MPYKFSNTASEVEPKSKMIDLYYALQQGKKLTAKENQQVFDGLYGMSGGHKGSYKLAGWQYDFQPFLKRFIVNHYGNWSTYYAPNKSCIRNCTYTRTGIVEIYEIKNKFV